MSSRFIRPKAGSKWLQILSFALGLLSLEQRSFADLGHFESTGNLSAGRYSTTATLLPNGKVLVAGTSATSMTELYDPVTDNWIPAGEQALPSFESPAVRLPNGKILFAGGNIWMGDQAFPFAGCQLYDYASGTWSVTGSLATAATGHSLTLLPNGRVLAVGGSNYFTGVATCELYEPASGTWSLTTCPITATHGPTTLLPNGKVLITLADSTVAKAELYDPATATWSSTGSFNIARYAYTQTLLSNGKVLVAAGHGAAPFPGGWLDSAELYDPSVGTWTMTGSLNHARDTATALLLADGTALVVGGLRSGPQGVQASAELFDPETETWAETGSLIRARVSHSVALLTNGQALVVGGIGNVGDDTALTAERYVGAAPPPPVSAHAFNLSTRMRVQTGNNVGIGGFILTGSAPKHVLLRAIGPSLGWLEGGSVLGDPVMELSGFGQGVMIKIACDNWRDDPGQEQAIIATGIPPANDLESAIDVTLQPGYYTAVVRGKNDTSGVGLIEIYDLDGATQSKLANLSTRAVVETGNDIVIAGFILGGGQSNGRIILRGIGSSLIPIGFADALADPTLELRDNNGALLMANNNWQDDPSQAAEISAAGLAPTDDLEPAIAAMPAPGLYTVLLAGTDQGTGLGVVEVYDLGSP